MPSLNPQTHSVSLHHPHQKTHSHPLLSTETERPGKADRLNLAGRSKLQFLSKPVPEIVLVL